MRRIGLWPQLFGLAALSIAVGLAASTVVVHQAADQQIEEFSEHRGELLAVRVATDLGRQYAEHGMAGLDAGVERMAQLLESPVVLRAPDGTLLLVAKPGARSTASGPTVSAPVLTPRGRFIATVTIHHANLFALPLVGVARSLNRIILLAALIGFIFALILSGLLGERMVTPLRRIADAARQLGAGDLSQRVDPSGPAEVSRLAEDFNRMAGQLEVSIQSQKQLIADVAHELRTPLAVLTGYLEAARDGVEVAGRDPVQLAEREAHQLTRLVDDLQELALADAHQLLLAPEPVTLADLIEPLAEEWEVIASRADIAFTHRIDPPDLRIEVDPGRIRQVLTNLLTNALKHTPSHGRIGLGAEARGVRVRFTVTDTGSGIAPEDLPHVFERLYRADRARTKPPAGTRDTGGFGLGLAIAKSLVEMHGGTIGAQPEAEGMTFWFEVPVRFPNA
jgi:signal transduction histidine kinase